MLFSQQHNNSNVTFFFVKLLYYSNKFLMQLHSRTQRAHYRGIAHILHIYTHMPYSILTFQISLQFSHTHSFIVSAYLYSTVWYVRFTYGDLVEASHQSYGFTAKSQRLFTYHVDRAIISTTCVIIYRPAGRSAFFECMSAIITLAGWVCSSLPAH